jgi:hypothetical protein
MVDEHGLERLKKVAAMTQLTMQKISEHHEVFSKV